MGTGEGEERSMDMSMTADLARYIEALPAGGPPARANGRTARRQRVVPQLRAHAARVHTRTRRLRTARRAALVVSAAASLAAVVVLVGGGRLGSTSHVAGVTAPAGATVAVLDGTLWLEDGVARRTLRTGEAAGLGATGTLEAPSAASTRVRLSNTATLTLAATSRVGTVVDAATDVGGSAAVEAVNLLRGRAHLKVTKLHAGQRFHVLTPDADVQVRGTEFDVELRPGSSPATCVRVEEGLVAVFAGGETHLVAPGQTWGCAPAASKATPAPREAPSSLRDGPARHAAALRASDLRAQNALFQAALSAERGGRAAEAAGLYERLLARSPHGPLSEQARENLAGIDVGRARLPR
jgi:FecR protein